MLGALFKRTQSRPWIDARQFRIDFKDQRDTIRTLVRTGFIVTTLEPNEQYRPALAALPLIESDAARSLLKEADRLLGYLERQYEAGCDQNLTVDRIAQDLQVSQQTSMELLRYIVETPVAGPRSSGFPNSLDWGLTPTEKSLDYPDLDALLNQLAQWMDRRVVDSSPVPYPIGIGHHEILKPAAPTRFDRLYNKIKNNPIGAILLILAIVLATLTAGLEAGRDLVAMVFSRS